MINHIMPTKSIKKFFEQFSDIDKNLLKEWTIRVKNN